MPFTIPNHTPAAVGGIDGTTSQTLSVVRAAGEGLLVVVMPNNSNGSPAAITSAIWDAAGDNQPMALLQSGVVTANKNAYMFYLPNPTSVKTGLITFNFASGDNTQYFVLVDHIKGHDPAVAARASAQYTQASFVYGTPISDVFTLSQAGDLVIDFVAYQGAGNVFSALAGQNDVYKSQAVAPVIASSSKPGAASVTMGWELQPGEVQHYGECHFIVSIAPAAVATTVPDAPTIGAATVTGATSVSVNGTAPANNGGAAITGYTATSTPGGITATSATLPVAVSGLTTGTAYTFRLHATSTVGNSAQSAASNSVTPVAGNVAPAFGGTIPNISGTVGTPISAPSVASYFSDTDTLTYSASPVGTAWPPGLTINATTGVPNGTPTASGTTTGCKVRASDGSLTADSNAFNFVIAAASTNKTWAPLGKLKNIMGGPAAGVAVHAFVNDKLTGALIEAKTGLVTGSDGGVAPFTTTAGTAGTSAEVKIVDDANPLRRSIEIVTPT